MLEKMPDAIGRALRDRRAGLDQLVYNQVDLRQGKAAITVTSGDFIDHAPLPVSCTADGDGLSPSLSWTTLPPSAMEVLVLVEDADSPTPHPLVHAIAVMPAEGRDGIANGELSDNAAIRRSEDTAPDRVQLGRNSYLQVGWLPPDPPPGHGPHRYAFQVYALNANVQFRGHPGRDAIVEALHAHAIASGCLIGTYERKDGSISEPASSSEPIASVVTPIA